MTTNHCKAASSFLRRKSTLPLYLTPFLFTFVACGTTDDEPNNGDETEFLGTTVDNDGDGQPDLVDINGDGIIDGLGIDIDGDGIADAIGLDTDGDGFVDALDFDGDGVPDPTPVTGTGGVAGDGDGMPGTGAAPAASGGSDGGTTDPSPEDVCVGNYLIDNFEEASTYSLFRPYNDGSPGGTSNHNGSFTADTSDGGGLAMQMSGSGFTNWGAGIGRQFDVPFARSVLLGFAFVPRGRPRSRLLHRFLRLSRRAKAGVVLPVMPVTTGTKRR